MEPVRPRDAKIGPGTLFSYAVASEEGWKAHPERWLVVDASEPLKFESAGSGPIQSVLIINQHGRCIHMHLYPSDKIVVHCE